jgi:hypothetical protein
MTVNRHCRDEGLVCAGQAFEDADCRKALALDGCFEKDVVACGADDEILRCVWTSEQESAKYSGDIGVWRVQTACADSGKHCVPQDHPVCAL